MKWSFPAKTFLVGEYVALQGGPALIVTTEPCFTVTIEKGLPTHPFPVGSPACNMWQKYLSAANYCINWSDPYNGLGGLGASSAQFLGVYNIKNYLTQHISTYNDLLNEYLHHAWNGEGAPPSGYDLIAQTLGGCAFIEKNKEIYRSYNWPFQDIGFILLHTNKKQATHIHLQNYQQLKDLTALTDITRNVCAAFFNSDARSFVNGINIFYKHLCELNLVAQHTLEMIAILNKSIDILAIKGCGALGADILLLIVDNANLQDKVDKIKQNGYKIIATSSNFKSSSLCSS